MIQILMTLLFLALSSTAFTQAPAAVPSQPSTTHSSSAPPSQPNSSVIWDAWYTVTVQTEAGPFAYGYYRDRLHYSEEKSQQKSRITFFNHYWKNEEGHLNEESMGAVCEDNVDLTPVYFNYRRLYRGQETLIDGTISENLKLSVSARRDSIPFRVQNPPSLPKGTFLSSHFSLWLSRKLDQLPKAQWITYRTLLEDSFEKGYPSVFGKVRLDSIEKDGSRKLTVDLNGVQSTWILDQKGVPSRILIPTLKTLVQRVTQTEAESFLKIK